MKRWEDTVPAHPNQLAVLRPPWQPGQAGGGAGHQSRLYRRAVTFARKHGLEAVETAVEMMRSEATPAATRLAACIFVFERAWGKPKETHELRDAAGAQMLRIEIVDVDGTSSVTTIEQPRDEPTQKVTDVTDTQCDDTAGEYPK